MKRVALTMRVTEAHGHGEMRDSISHEWLTLTHDWDLTPFPVPNLLTSPGEYLDGIAPDILVLTGGDDLGTTPARDQTERRLLEHAIAAGVPVLGVCRGMQLINDYFGGNLAAIEGHVARPHEIVPARGWEDHYVPGTIVNSFHALAIAGDGLGEDLAALAFDKSGHIEALHHKTLPLAAVMWHPERAQAPAGDRGLISRLADGGAFWA